MRFCSPLNFVALLVCSSSFAGSPAEKLKPWLEEAVDVETGMLWKVGGDTAFNYRIVPFFVSRRSSEVFGFHFSDGSALTLRNKYTLMANWMETGCENRYLGVAAAPSIEWWNPRATWSVFGSAGGGVGVLDAQGVTGGEGQDFTFNWYGQLGVSAELTQRWTLRGSALFQHLSNGGQTNPNPGLNALGFTLGVGRSF
jgi:lipid A 3-O-deacylase